MDDDSRRVLRAIVDDWKDGTLMLEEAAHQMAARAAAALGETIQERHTHDTRDAEPIGFPNERVTSDQTDSLLGVLTDRGFGVRERNVGQLRCKRNREGAMEKASIEGWAILELMGHRRLAGRVSEQEIAGVNMLRIDVPGEGDAITATQFYSASSLYCLTPTTEEIARQVARGSQPAPVQRWELQERPALPPAASPIDDDDDTPY